MSKKVKKKVSSVLMNEVVKELKLRGVKISDDDVDHLRSKNIVSSRSRDISSYKIKDEEVN